MVPNLPSPIKIPAPGITGAPEAEGTTEDLFARLLGGGPQLTVVAGPGAIPVDEVTLRAAPADGDSESADGETVVEDPGQPEIIPLLQAQSGFPLAVVPPVPVAASADVTEAMTGVPAQPPRFEWVSQPVQPVPEEQAAQQDGDPAPEAGIAADAVKAAIDKFAGKPVVRAGKPGRSSPVAIEQGKPVEAAPASALSRPVEQVAARVEAAAQHNLRIPVAFAPEPVAPQSAAPVAASSTRAAPDVAELVVERQLDIANDNRWLDRLARDIARTAAGDEPLRFRLHPQTLGHLQVELTQSDRGANVRLTVETEAARNILVDAQPRLAAEARAQGVRLAGTEVDLGTAGRQGGDARRNEAQPQNIVRVVSGDQSSSPESGPAEGRSDRYA